MIFCYDLLITGWLVDDTFQPSFSDLKDAMKTFSITPDQYVFTVVSIVSFNIAFLEIFAYHAYYS